MAHHSSGPPTCSDSCPYFVLNDYDAQTLGASASASSSLRAVPLVVKWVDPAADDSLSPLDAYAPWDKDVHCSIPGLRNGAFAPVECAFFMVRASKSTDRAVPAAFRQSIMCPGVLLPRSR